MRAAVNSASERDCATINLQAAEWNVSVRRCYERIGAHADHMWLDDSLSETTLRELTDEAT